MRAQEDYLSKVELDHFLSALQKAGESGDVMALKKILKEVVTGFTSHDERVDVFFIRKRINLE